MKFIDTGPTFHLNHDVSWRIKKKSISTEDTENQNENNLNVYETAIVFKLVSTLLQVSITILQKNSRQIFFFHSRLV